MPIGAGTPRRSAHGQVIDCRHVIHSLGRKPIALLNLVCRDPLFPRRAYARAFDALLVRGPERVACRTVFELLARAHVRACEAELPPLLDADLAAGWLPDMPAIRARFAPDPSKIPIVRVDLAPLSASGELGTVRTAEPRFGVTA